MHQAQEQRALHKCNVTSHFPKEKDLSDITMHMLINTGARISKGGYLPAQLRCVQICNQWLQEGQIIHAGHSP